mgnify:CR=1 FL=1
MIDHLRPIDPIETALPDDCIDPTTSMPPETVEPPRETILVDDNVSVEVRVKHDYNWMHVDVPRFEGCDSREAIWTTVWFARAIGVPGTWKEQLRIVVDDNELEAYRLGALYRYAEFPLRERETNYAEYGENPEYDT